MIIKRYKLKFSKNIKYNSYMSKSFIYTHLNELDLGNKYNIYFSEDLFVSRTHFPPIVFLDHLVKKFT